MIATSGDEAFVMLALFPQKALLLFSLLFVLGIIGAWLSDRTASWLGFTSYATCELQVVHSEDRCQCFDPMALRLASKWLLTRYILSFMLLLFLVTVGMGVIGPEKWNCVRVTFLVSAALSITIILTVPDHYLEEHIWRHIIKEHLWQVFLWTFSALLFIRIGLEHWNIEAFVTTHPTWMFLICVLVGLIPESGPHMIFVMMFAHGIVPFSILLTSSIVQDGHGMLPMFSYSVKDALKVKMFNLAFGVLIGLPLLLFGF